MTVSDSSHSPVEDRPADFATERPCASMRPLFLWALTTNVLACHADPNPMAGFSERDSAGVVIVENGEGAEDRAPAWPVEDGAIVKIGVVEGEKEYQFSRIAGVAMTKDGTIVVLDALDRELRFFGLDGRHIRTVGGPGDGPGEFDEPSRLLITPDDSLAVWDERQRRFTFFGPEGELGSVLNTVAEPAGRYTSPYIPLGFVSGKVLVASAGSVIMSSSADRVGIRHGEPERIRIQQKSFMRMDLAPERLGTKVDTIASLGELLLVEWAIDRIRGVVTVPYTVDGSGAVGAGRLVATSGSERALEVYDSVGRLIRTVRVAGAAEVLTPSLFANEVERRLSDVQRPELLAELRRLYDAMSPPATIPAYSGSLLSADPAMIVDETGYVWVERFRPDWDSPRRAGPENPSVWTVFDETGAVVGSAMLPPGFALHQVTPHGLLGVYRDELDVEYVWLLPG